MITAYSNVVIQKVLKAGTVTSYTSDKVSLFIKHEGVQKRFNPTSIVNATSNSAGSISFSVGLWGDGSYSMYITAENSSDMDVSGVQLVTLATGYIKKISDNGTMVL